jgi:hypothetical protein
MVEQRWGVSAPCARADSVGNEERREWGTRVTPALASTAWCNRMRGDGERDHGTTAGV